MARTKRCPFCGHKLDADGWCRNTNCADYIRTQTHDAEVAKKAAKSGTTTSDSSSANTTTTN